MKKYELVYDDFKMVHGVKVFRIKALVNVGYEVAKGDLGGYVQGYNNLSQSGKSWVYDNACVINNARVKGNATIRDNAIIKNNAIVRGKSIVGDDAIIGDNAKIYDDARVGGFAYVGDNSRVNEYCHVLDNATICDDSRIRGFAHVGGKVVVKGKSILEHQAYEVGDDILENVFIDEWREFESIEI